MPSDPRHDPELIAAANAGDPDGFEALYLRYRDWAASLAFRYTGDRDAALDVMQDAFLYLLRKFPGFELTSRFKTFLYPVVRHLALERRRKDARLARLGDTAVEPAAALPPAGGDRDELAAVVSGLPEGQREALLLRFVDGLSLAEVAAAMGLPVGTVKSRLHHAITALRDDPRIEKYFER